MSRDDADARAVGFTSHDDVALYQAQAAAEADINTVLQRAVWDSAEVVLCAAQQPAHTEAEVQQLMLCVADWEVERHQYEALVRRILGVPK